MAITLNGTTQYISTTTATITAYPFTLFAYFNPTATGVAYYIFDVSNDTAPVLNAYKLRAAGDSSNNVRLTVGDGSTSDATSTSTTFSATTWQRASYVGTSATSRDVRLNNAGIGSGSTNLTATGISKTYVGVTNLNTVLSGFFSGSLAYVAIWNVALGATDRAFLEAGRNPFFVQRAALKTFVRLDSAVSAVTDTTGLCTWTAVAAPTYSTSPGLMEYRHYL